MARQWDGFRALALMALIFLFSACGLPGDLKNAAKAKTDQVAVSRQTVSRQKADYLDYTQTAGFDFFKPYAEKENWALQFQNAEKFLTRAETALTNGRVAVLIDENNRSKAGELRVELATVDRMIRKALQAADAPERRKAELKKIQAEASLRVDQALASLEGIHRLIRPLEANFIPGVQKDFPLRSTDIATRFEPLKTLEAEAETALIQAQHQLQRHQTEGNADYAILGRETDRVTGNLKLLSKQNEDYRAKMGELYHDYTKILEDMRMDYHVTVGRVSWDEGSDFWTAHNFIYPPSTVDRKIYDYFVKLNPNTVPATYQTFFSRKVKVNISPNYWNALKIHPTLQWPSNSDNQAEFWIEDVFPKAYHKYTIVENNSRKTTGWVEVDEEDFMDHQDNLGMEIVSKPYGFFEDETAIEAAPPGMGFVGNSRYGEWRTDSSTGRSFWYYYGIYSFLNRGPRYGYYRNDWDRWRSGYRGRKPYYGGGASTYGTYGTHVRTDSRYQNTDFAKRGGLKTQAASVRGAGPARRGGGPGGRGK